MPEPTTMPAPVTAPAPQVAATTVLPKSKGLSRPLKIALLALYTLLVAGVVMVITMAVERSIQPPLQQAQNPNPAPVANPNPAPNPAPAPQTPPVSPAPAAAAPTPYKNQYMQLSILPGWSTKQGSIHTTGDVDTTTDDPSEVIITKGIYMLDIRTRKEQTSGIKGGRFGEITTEPSTGAVITVQPSGPCGTEDAVKIQESPYVTWSRHDFYYSTADKRAYCADAPAGKNIWYFSYVNTDANGYINYYVDGQPMGYTITMGLNSTDLASFPVKGDPELQKMLGEMTEMVNGIQIVRP